MTDNGFLTRNIVAVLLTIVMILAVGMEFTARAQSNASSAASWGPKWTTKGELILPKGFNNWVFLGAPLTPNALNDGKANFPEYHNVYIRPEPLEIYRETGKWPDGTILLKELQLTLPGENSDGSSYESSGRGYFPGPVNGIDIAVKDSSRFKETNDWGYFNFGHHAPPYAKTASAQPADACASCHTANATDMVFTKFYAPILEKR